jgi:hypothetical protein
MSRNLFWTSLNVFLYSLPFISTDLKVVRKDWRNL